MHPACQDKSRSIIIFYVEYAYEKITYGELGKRIGRGSLITPQIFIFTIYQTLCHLSRFVNDVGVVICNLGECIQTFKWKTLQWFCDKWRYMLTACARFLIKFDTKLEQLQRLRSEDTPRHPMITHTIDQFILSPKSILLTSSYRIPSQNKVKAEKLGKFAQKLKF